MLSKQYSALFVAVARGYFSRGGQVACVSKPSPGRGSCRVATEEVGKLILALRLFKPSNLIHRKAVPQSASAIKASGYGYGQHTVLSA